MLHVDHDTSWNLPLGGSFLFKPEPVPEDPCGPTGPEMRAECEQNFENRWDDVSCTCQPRFICKFCDQPVH